MRERNISGEVIRKGALGVLAMALVAVSAAKGAEVLVEAEGFAEHGGWQLDTQFIEIMGSPYLMAHGLGRPVADAKTVVKFPEAGKYRMWVRTKDWVAKYGAEGSPGRFQVLVGGEVVGGEFGNKGADWHWQDGGEVELAAGEVEVALRDLTGFNGRCDALLFTTDAGFVPDNTSEILPAWRRKMLGVAEGETTEGEFDIVFIGGGYAGSCGAISAARMGLKVALVQNRFVLGGNGSSEVQVWAMGEIPPGLYPVGDIVNEFTDHATKSPGTIEEFEDEKKLRLAGAEKNLTVYLGHHAYGVEMEEGGKRIAAVKAFDVRTGEIKRFAAEFFCDATGHGYIGMKAGADTAMLEKGRMGMSNMWNWSETGSEQKFPETAWALDLEEADFPYPVRYHAQWFWESGFNKDPLDDLEEIRDWNLRAAYGAWNAIKNKGAYGRHDATKQGHRNARLEWLAYVGGTRETQQILGDVILTEEDIVSKKSFPDGCVLTTWSVDLHYPKEEYAKKFPDNPFIARAVHGKGVDRKVGYPVPYRCFYSRNIENLFMAGRNISVTHEALGTVRVMKTCGMMGVVVGKAAAVCKEFNTTPRGVYQSYLDELIKLMEMPGNVRREAVGKEFAVDPTIVVAQPRRGSDGGTPMDIAKLEGVVVDDAKARFEGSWTEGSGLSGYVGSGYRYLGAGTKGKATYPLPVVKAGKYEVRVGWLPHENRATNTTVVVRHAGGEKAVKVNQRVAASETGFFSLGVFDFEPGKAAEVEMSNPGADGNIHADAVQVIPRG